MAENLYMQYELAVLTEIRKHFSDDHIGVDELDRAIEAKSAKSDIDAFVRDYAIGQNEFGELEVPMYLKALCSDDRLRRFYPTQRTMTSSTILKGSVQVRRYSVSGIAYYNAERGLLFEADPLSSNSDLLPKG